MRIWYVFVSSVLLAAILLLGLGQVVSAETNCTIPESGPWPACATGANNASTVTNTANPNCIIPISGPWPPCATSGATAAPSTAGGDCVIPASGPWPPCATGGTTSATVSGGSGGDCVIPPSGPWPPCATGGAAVATVSNGSSGDCVIPPSGPWPPCATSGGGSATAISGGVGGDCVIPTSGPWPPCATSGGTVAQSSAYTISYRQRFGVTGQTAQAHTARNLGMNFGSYINWGVTNPATVPSETVTWQMVRVGADGAKMTDAAISSAAKANVGATWVVGNEPDVVVQDNVTPERYAEIYHDVYTVIKNADPSAQVAIAGVAAPTALRMQYLDRVLAAYEAAHGTKMPIDVWTVHVYVLREQRDSWGIGIPPGFDGVNDGVLHEIDDHNNHAIANQMIVDFRAYMNRKGYRQAPLAITEFGILLPEDFGFTPDVVADYMRNTINFYLSAANGTGFSADNNKLVQQWFWFSLYEESEFSTGNLLDVPNNKLTPIGSVYADFVR